MTLLKELEQELLLPLRVGIQRHGGRVDDIKTFIKDAAKIPRSSAMSPTDRQPAMQKPGLIKSRYSLTCCTVLPVLCCVHHDGT